MRRNESIVRYTADDEGAPITSGQGLTDWARVDAMTEEELEAKIATDEEADIEWGPFHAGLPPGIGTPKKQLTVRLDPDVVEWFKSQGKGYQTRMNAVLRQYMEHQKSRAAS